MIIKGEFSADENNWARGRNGIFKPAKIIVFGDDRLFVEIESKQTGKNAPINMNLNLKDAVTLANVLLDGVKQVKARKRLLRRLEREAHESCCNRGHKMRPFQMTGTHTAISTCRICGMEVHIDATPPPNGIDIGGEAVAGHCTGEGSKTCKVCTSTYSPDEVKMISPGLPEGYCGERCYMRDGREGLTLED